MSEVFDAYHKWLGIPPNEQPPNLYRLLGIGIFEADLDVIEGAADRQMAHVQTHKTGPYAARSQEVLNELSAAKLCLLDPGKKSAYDAQLRNQLAGGAVPRPAAPPAAPPAPRPAPRPVAPQAQAAPEAEAVIVEDEPQIAVASTTSAGGGSGGAASYTRRRRSSNLPIVMGTLAVGLVAIVVLLIVAAQQADEQEGGDGTSVAANNRGTGRTRVSTNRRVNPRRVRTGDSAFWNNDDGGQSSNGGDGTSNGSDGTSAGADGGIADGGGADGENADGGSQATITSNPGGGSDGGTSVGPAGGTNQGSDEPRSLADLLRPSGGVTRQRSPVPDEEEQKKILREIRELFDEDFRKARTPETRFQLAEKLFNEGKKTNDDPVSRYVLLREAGEYAASIGVPIAAVMAVDELDKGYEIDGLQQKSETLLESARNVASPAAVDAAIRTAMSLAEEAVRADRFDLANQFFRAAKIAAAKSRERVRKLKPINERDSEVSEIAKLYERAAAAQETLDTDPGAADANEAAGCYLCLIKGAWKDGLPYLVKSQNPKLRELAQRELDEPSEGTQQRLLADGWLAYGQGGDNLLEVRALVRARYWYRRAQSQLKGLDRTRVDKALEQIQQELGASGWSIRMTI